MKSRGQDQSRDSAGRITATQVFAILNEERGSDAWRQSQTAERPIRSESRVEAPEPRLIGIISTTPDLPQAMHPFFGPVLAGIKARIIAARCDMFVPSYNPAPPLGSDPQTIERCHTHGAQGLIVMGLDSADPDFPLMLESGLPIMVVDCQAIGERVGFVMSNGIDGMATAVRHLYKLGRRRIATITGLMLTRPAIDRLLGYRSELDRLGLEQRPEYVVESDFTPASGYEQMKRLLALPEPPDAVAAVSDLTAVGAIVAIEEFGLRVPEDIAVVGFDDSPFAPVMRPALTTVHPNALELGMAAADGILAMLDRPDDPPPTIVLPVALVVRESCGIELLQQDASGERAAN